MLRRLCLAAPLALLSCNQYDVFLLSGYEQSTFSNDADIVFIIDNSDSMTDEAEALAQNFSSFIRDLTSASSYGDEGLTAAVSDYISSTGDRGSVIDFQLGITTTSIAGDAPGRAGTLVGSPDIVTKGSDDVALNFTRSLLCEATCFNVNLVPADSTYQCDADNPEMPNPISQQYLDCLCGSDRWENNCGAGTEEGLEAAFDAMCRAADNPPEECFTEYTELASLSETDAGTSSGLIRQDSTVIFVVVSDEGDGSRRIENTNPNPEKYTDLLDKFNKRYRFAVIGPPYDPETDSLTCNSGGATKWGTERYQNIATSSSGFFNTISGEDETGECGITDFSVHLDDLGKLLNSLKTSFPLQSTPDINTIQAFVDGSQVAQAVDTRSQADQAIGGDPLYEEGWAYDPGTNSVVFYGNTIPQYGEEVRIYYRPLEGMPRELPF
ncbi:MAG: hypothetical protein VXW32_10985 [Myxococcota bacterium]|nr:hypothetical protein [Myxococcota bacterium]